MNNTRPMMGLCQSNNTSPTHSRSNSSDTGDHPWHSLSELYNPGSAEEQQPTPAVLSPSYQPPPLQRTLSAEDIEQIQRLECKEDFQQVMQDIESSPTAAATEPAAVFLSAAEAGNEEGKGSAAAAEAPVIRRFSDSFDLFTSFTNFKDFKSGKTTLLSNDCPLVGTTTFYRGVQQVSNTMRLLVAVFTASAVQ